MEENDGLIHITIKNAVMSIAVGEVNAEEDRQHESGYELVSIEWNYSPEDCAWVYKLVFKRRQG